jgi:hypothetical protein
MAGITAYFKTLARRNIYVLCNLAHLVRSIVAGLDIQVQTPHLSFASFGINVAGHIWRLNAA